MFHVKHQVVSNRRRTMKEIKPQDQPRGVGKVYDRESGEVGKLSGRSHDCQLADCNGLLLSTQWPDGSWTYPCTSGMVLVQRPMRDVEHDAKIEPGMWLIPRTASVAEDLHDALPDLNPPDTAGWIAIHEASPKEADGVTVLQMPCNWSADDMVGCLVSEFGMTANEILAVLSDRDLCIRILAKFQENLATTDWMDDMKYAIEHVMEEDDDSDE